MVGCSRGDARYKYVEQLFDVTRLCRRGGGRSIGGRDVSQKRPRGAEPQGKTGREARVCQKIESLGRSDARPNARGKNQSGRGTRYQKRVDLWSVHCSVKLTNDFQLSHCLLVDLTRQYKTMQTQMEGRIDHLESQVKKLQAELGTHASATEYTQAPIHLVIL